MLGLKHTIFGVALVTAAAVTVVPAYAEGSKKPEATTGHEDKGGHADKATAACTADELAAYLATARAGHSDKPNTDKPNDGKSDKHGKDAKTGKNEPAKHPEPGLADPTRRVTADGAPTSDQSAGDTAANEAEQKARAARKARQAAERAAEEKARGLEKAAQACGREKQDKASHDRKEADTKARARKFQAIGVVASQDLAAGTVTVLIKAGSPDLHMRKLAIKVTADTEIKLNDKPVAVGALASGTFVSVHGVRVEGALVAGRINAATPSVEVDEPTTSASPSTLPSPASPSAPEAG